MHIDAVASALPKRIVSNNDVLEMVRQESQFAFEGDLDKTLKMISMFLRLSGAKRRRMLHPDELVWDYIKGSINEALEKASLLPSDIDLVIHASVDRRVAEPGHSFFIANAMGMHRAQCFDLLEACASWSRAVHIAQAYLQAGMYKEILIVTAEFGLHEGEWGRNTYKLSKPEDIEWAFASYTLGESATATIVSADDDKPWYFDSIAYNEHSEFCVVPYGITRLGTMQYGDVSLTGAGPQKFACQARNMQEVGKKVVAELMSRMRFSPESLDLIFPHTHAKQTWLDVAKESYLNLPYYFVYPEYGNLISGSIPVAMADAEREGALKRGHHVAAWMTAAGMTFHFFDFVY